MIKNKSKTENFLLTLTGVLLIVLAANVVSGEPSGTKVIASEQNGAESEKSTSSSSVDGEQSEESEDGEESEVAEESEQSEASEESVQTETSEKSVRSQASINTAAVGEKSEDGVEGDVSEEELSEESIQSEKSVKSGEAKTIATRENERTVKHNEKLFFLFPVEIESQATLDESGNVVKEKKNFMNWFLSVFSF